MPLLLLAGCTEPADPTMPVAAPAPCPGHFHVTLLVANGTEVVPFYDEDPGRDDRDAREPVAGIHMHGDDGVIHIHPAQEACYTLAATLHAVDVQVLPRGAVQVNDDVREGDVRIDVQLWSDDWTTWSEGDLQRTVPDAARVLVMVNPSSDADIDRLRDQVPQVPEVYQP